ncbi:MAG: TonB-dependent receptor plug domain-containing protein [Ignavibacteria bacterium]|nr:TonB-dependent receptor plug domain-containing protein [Ignavibacteria bacterium]
MFFAYCFILFSFVTIKIFSKDTTEARTNEVLVESIYNQEFVGKILLVKDRFNKNDLKDFNLRQLSEAISLLPGVYVRDYGGLGGIKTISLRGFSAVNTAILLDGEKINNQQNGIFDLNLLPLPFVDEIEIIRGGISSIIGNNSDAGVINISFRKATNHKMALGFGSFGTLNLKTVIPLQFSNNSNTTIGISYQKSNGDYPIKANLFGDDIIYRRQNSRYKNFSLFLNNENKVIFGLFSIKFLYSNSKRGVPGPILTNYFENLNASLEDQFLWGNFLFKPYILKDSNLKISLSLTNLKNLFNDPDGIGVILKKEKAQFVNREARITVSYNNYFLNTNYEVGKEFTFSDLQGDFLQPSIGSYVKRLSFSPFLRAQSLFSIGSTTLILFTATRFDITNTFPNFFSYSLGLAVNFNKNLPNIRLNFSDNFRFPTFNEMYYLNYGNEDLKPEATKSFNLSLEHNSFDFLHTSISLFHYYTQNKIISVPKNPVQWTAKNLGLVNSTGAEIHLRLESKWFSLMSSFTYQKVMNKSSNSLNYGKTVVYTPEVISESAVNVKLPFESYLILKGSYISSRFSLPDNSSTSKLNPYFIFNIGLSKDLKLAGFKLNFNFEISNLFDESYQIILNYPMPGRMILFNTSVEY